MKISITIQGPITIEINGDPRELPAHLSAGLSQLAARETELPKADSKAHELLAKLREQRQTGGGWTAPGASVAAESSSISADAAPDEESRGFVIVYGSKDFEGKDAHWALNPDYLWGVGIETPNDSVVDLKTMVEQYPDAQFEPLVSGAIFDSANKNTVTRDQFNQICEFFGSMRFDFSEDFTPPVLPTAK